MASCKRSKSCLKSSPSTVKQSCFFKKNGKEKSRLPIEKQPKPLRNIVILDNHTYAYLDIIKFIRLLPYYKHANQTHTYLNTKYVTFSLFFTTTQGRISKVTYNKELARLIKYSDTKFDFEWFWRVSEMQSI